MLIRLKEFGTENVILVNIKVEEYTMITVQDNRLLLHKDESISSMAFESTEKANEARDKIFERFGTKAPSSKVLNLLDDGFDDIIDAEIIEEETEEDEENDGEDSQEETIYTKDIKEGIEE